jgi:glycerol-3-phosphate acyltransferase PlsY
LILSTVLFAFVSYLLGSIPFSYLAGKLFKGIDLREHGSGNLGATNTYRMLGLGAALLVGILDALKAYLPVLFFPGLILSYSQTPATEIIFGTKISIVIKMILGVCAISGHVWTLFLGFKGGKGVTTAFGVFLAITPLATAISLGVWILVLSITRRVSLASITTAILFPLFLVLLRKNLFDSEMILFIFSLIVTVLVIFTHRSNISRLLRGEEKKINREES